jgi:hypothetical protein
MELILDSLSRMVADVNHGPDDLKRRARQLPAQGYKGAQRKKGIRRSRITDNLKSK